MGVRRNSWRHRSILRTTTCPLRSIIYSNVVSDTAGRAIRVFRTIRYTKGVSDRVYLGAEKKCKEQLTECPEKLEAPVESQR